MDVTLYDWITQAPCGIWRVDPTPTGEIVFKGIPGTENDGCRLDFHWSSCPDSTPGETMFWCFASDGKPYCYGVANEIFDQIKEAAHPFWPA